MKTLCIRKNIPVRSEPSCAAFARFHGREWVKLNASYVAATAVNFSVAIGTAKLAEKSGVSKENAATWLSFASGFTAGFATLVGSWYLMHRERYSGHLETLGTDAWIMFKNIWKAQSVSIAIVLPICWIAASLLSTEVVVLLQQVLDRAFFVPAFNLFSRHQVRELSHNKTTEVK